MAFKIKDLQNDFGEIIEQIGEMLGAKVIEESEEEYKIYCTTSYFYFSKLNVNVHTASLFIYNADIDFYDITDNIILVFDADKKELVYSEQGGTLETTLYNYNNIILKKKTLMEDVMKFECEYVLDKGDILDSYGKVTSYT